MWRHLVHGGTSNSNQGMRGRGLVRALDLEGWRLRFRRLSVIACEMLTTAELGGLVGTFSATHIGLSAVRESLIERAGRACGSLGIVGRDVKLPSFWLADTSGYDVWPDEATAGRQVYRAGYTLVSSALLFPALAAYPELRAATIEASASPPLLQLSADVWWAFFACASAAQAISIASLVNPSPLSLVPAFEADGDALLRVKRNDRLKLNPFGLTRITRHPLILPVVPWGVSNALLAGGRTPDLILFGGLAVYAIAGCWAQDLRVANEEGSVGTTLEQGALSNFFRATSFAPFGAVLAGRQSLEDVRREVPWSALAAGLVVGAAIEWATLEWWVGVGGPPL